MTSTATKMTSGFAAVDGREIYTRIAHNGKEIKIIHTAHIIYEVCVCVCGKKMKLYISNIYTFIFEV